MGVFAPKTILIVEDSTLNAQITRDAIVMLDGQGRQMLAQEIERTRRTGRAFSIVMLDLDHFKSINDRFGHAVGDVVLKTIAGAISQRIRKTDILARWGGEEFIILLPETPADGAANLAGELRASLNSLIIPEVGHVTASFGVATYVPPDTVDTIIMRADHMLYEAKAAGRNCVQCANQSAEKKQTLKVASPGNEQMAGAL